MNRMSYFAQMQNILLLDLLIGIININNLRVNKILKNIHEGWISNKSFSPNGNYVVTWSADSTINITNIYKNKVLKRQILLNSSPVWCFFYFPLMENQWYQGLIIQKKVIL